MDLSIDTLTFIQSVLKTAKLVKIQNVIIEPGKIRAMDDAQTVVIFQTINIPEMEFGSIGLNRIDVFMSRFDIIRTTSGFVIEATTAGMDPSIGYDKYDLKQKNIDPPMWAKSIKMTGKNTNIDYRCTNPSLMKAPKSRNDDAKYLIKMNNEAFNMIQKGKTAMQSELISFVGTAKGVFIHLTDINGDVLKYKFSDKIETVNKTDISVPTFQYNYNIETLLPIFKQDPEVNFNITHKGFLVVNINGLDIFLAPRT